jgi:glyoxylase-like metal-dependent hydrolase (beta-lactamase superfamily II)
MEVTKGIHQVDGANGNVYVIVNGQELVLVDTGMPRSTEKIVDCVRSIGWQPSNISTIVLTHCHVDHVGSAYELKKLTNAKVAIHEEDADFAAGKKSLPRPKGVVGVLFKAASVFFKFTLVQPGITLKENDRLGKLTVIHTPGHTPGSISLHDPERSVLFVGDAMRFVRGKISGPPERFTLDHEQAVRSIEKISQLEFDVMLSGHGEPLKPDVSERVRQFRNSLK